LFARAQDKHAAHLHSGAVNRRTKEGKKGKFGATLRIKSIAGSRAKREREREKVFF